MPRKLDTFEFPHGGRKGMDFNFEELCDGSIWELEKGVDWDAGSDEPRSAETFLGALSRYANSKDMRVNKHVSNDGNVITIRVRPKKVKTENESNGQTDAAEKPARTRASK